MDGIGTVQVPGKPRLLSFLLAAIETVETRTESRVVSYIIMCSFRFVFLASGVEAHDLV